MLFDEANNRMRAPTFIQKGHTIKILFLTTQTPHHAYFVQEIVKDWPDCHAVIETTSVQAPFDAGHQSDQVRDLYEIDACLGGEDIRITDIVPSISVENINDPETVTFIQDLQPNLIIDFGTRKVNPEIINIMPQRIFNLHGGDPAQYRGLDTHMWAMYHKDFSELKTTLHHLNADLDDGGIIGVRAVHVSKDMKIHEFRRANTDTCIALVQDMLKTYKEKGAVESSAQKQKGRYYSFMPSVLKDIAARNFEA